MPYTQYPIITHHTPLKLILKTPGIWYDSIAYLSFQIGTDTGHRHSVAIGNGVECVGPEYSLVGIHEDGIPDVCVNAGLTVFHKIGIGILLEQIAYANDTVAELIVKLSGIVKPVKKTDLVGPAAEKDAVPESRLQGKDAYCSQRGSRQRALPILSASPLTP